MQTLEHRGGVQFVAFVSGVAVSAAERAGCVSAASAAAPRLSSRSANRRVRTFRSAQKYVVHARKDPENRDPADEPDLFVPVFAVVAIMGYSLIILYDFLKNFRH
ncbi:hypothetical protein FVE85_0518 [Porphyridium purpureum]|uniref:Uncharacterized protein n=1 Tax=Porphyridium purpureum TaxID=35688 RepID=A0A5J4YYU4_PORPP|nr:hypothetical protein FVE85_0518 [Porphyridium purpureum]|eukprot:POR1457..scf208_2